MEKYNLTQTGPEVQEILDGAATLADVNDEADTRAGADAALRELIDEISALIPEAASALNQLADKQFVSEEIIEQIVAAIPNFAGQFTTLAQLQDVESPKAGDIGIVRTKDTDGHDVFTFYQYKDGQWNEFYSLSYHPQRKPASTGLVGEAPYNGMGRIELPMNWVEGWPNDTWLYYPYHDIVYLMYYWNGQIYAVYNAGTQEGLGLDDNLVVKPLDYNIADIQEFVGERHLPFTESSGVWTITKPDDSTITSTELNNTNIYKVNDPTHLGINVLTQAMINRPNTIYVIQYDFTLGEDINVPENCILEFDGGSLSNGTIVYNKTVVWGFCKSYHNIHTQGKLDNEKIILEHYGNYPAEALTHLCTIEDAEDRVFPVIQITDSITLEDDVVISNNTQFDHIITIAGTGKETRIYTNGHHIKGRHSLREGDQDGIFDGMVRFENLAFIGTGTEGEINENYTVDCDTMLRLYFIGCFILNTKCFLKANSNVDWMQTITVRDCYCRHIDCLIYSLHMSPDIKVLNTTVEASLNCIHIEGDTYGLLVKDCCIEGISMRPIYLGGRILNATIADNYFESNGSELEGCQVDLSDAASINLEFSGNMISQYADPSQDKDFYFNPVIKLPDNEVSLTHLDQVTGGYDSHLTAFNNAIAHDSVGGVLVECDYPFRRFLTAYGNSNLAVNVPQPLDNITTNIKFNFADSEEQAGYSNTMFFEFTPYNISIVQGSNKAIITNVRALTAEELEYFYILRTDANAISLHCNNYNLMQELKGRNVTIQINYDVPDYSNFKSSIAITDNTDSKPVQPTIFPTTTYPSVYEHVVLNNYEDFASQIADLSYKIVHVRHLFDLDNDSVTLPNNCIFVFDGGGLQKGTVVCSSSTTLDCASGAMQMFNLNIILNNAKIYPDYNTLIKNGAVCSGMPAAGTFWFDNGVLKWSDGASWYVVSSSEIDEMTFKTTKMVSRTINVPGQTVHCEIISGNNTFTGGVTSVDITDSTTDADVTFTDPTALTEVKINNKLNLNYFWIYNGEADFDQLKNSDITDFIVTGGDSVIFGNVKCKNIAGKLELNNGSLNIPQKLSEMFGEINSITRVSFAIKGIIHEDNELSILGKCTSIQRIQLKGNDDDGEYRGSIEGFVQVSRANGRTTGNVDVRLPSSTLITFNGGNAGSSSYPTGLQLSWDATTITYNGVTINA